MTPAKIISELLAMPPKKRAKIAGILLRSLDEDEAVDQQDIDRAWAREIEHRVEEIRSGRAKLVAGDAFGDRLRAKVRQARRPAR